MSLSSSWKNTNINYCCRSCCCHNSNTLQSRPVPSNSSPSFHHSDRQGPGAGWEGANSHPLVLSILLGTTQLNYLPSHLPLQWQRVCEGELMVVIVVMAFVVEEEVVEHFRPLFVVGEANGRDGGGGGDWTVILVVRVYCWEAPTAAPTRFD